MCYPVFVLFLLVALWRPGVLTERVDCNFDKDLCGWTMDRSSADFQWTRHWGPTSSGSTGPYHDHTWNVTFGGYYLYIESSSPRVTGDRARLFSPQVPARNQTYPLCFSMWYSMNGATIGSLNVYVQQNKTTSYTRPVWTRSGNQGPDWTRMTLTLDYHSPVTIVVEGVVGRGYSGDIAIDDIFLQSGSCDNSVDCDFEQSLCAWSQAAGDDSDWLRHSGSWTSLYTGPDEDHTLRNGHYVFMDSTSPATTGARAELISPTLHPRNSQYQCLRFWYHMYGRFMGQLNVIARHPVDGATYRNTTLKHIARNHGNFWLSANVTVSPPGPLTIIFEAIRGPGNSSDIALDDVKLTEGKCESTSGVPVIG